MKIKFLIVLFLIVNYTANGQEKFLKLTDILVIDSSKTSAMCCSDYTYYKLTVPAGKFYKITFLQCNMSGNNFQFATYIKINSARIYQIQDEAVNPNSNSNFVRKSELWLKGGDVLEYIGNASGGGYTSTVTLYLSAQVYELSQ